VQDIHHVIASNRVDDGLNYMQVFTCMSSESDHHRMIETIAYQRRFDFKVGTANRRGSHRFFAQGQGSCPKNKADAVDACLTFESVVPIEKI
jgi:hypothetical protein